MYVFLYKIVPTRMIYLDDVRDRIHGSYQMDNNSPRKHCRGKRETNSATLILSPQSFHGRKLSAKQKRIFWSRVSPTKQFQIFCNRQSWKTCCLFLSFFKPSIQEIVQIVIFLLDLLWLHGSCRRSCCLFLAIGIVGVKVFQLYWKAG